jgi:hypothetical protein
MHNSGGCVKLDFDPDPASVPAARGQLTRVSKSWPVSEACGYRAQLLLAEVVTHAVLHAGHTLYC